MEKVRVAITAAFAAGDGCNDIWGTHILADVSHLNHTGFNIDQI